MELHERTVGKYLAALGYRRLFGAPAAPEDRSGGAGRFQKSFPEAVAAAILEAARGRPLEVWFQDEARIGQQGTLTSVWAECGSRPRAPREARYQWAYFFGVVCPERGAAAGLVMPFADTAAMNDHLAEIVAVRAHQKFAARNAPHTVGNSPPDLLVHSCLRYLPVARARARAREEISALG